MDSKHGEYCGTAIIDGTSCDIFSKKGHFGQVFNNKFYGHVKKSKLRKVGIFSPGTPRKKVYGSHGYVGCGKNQ